MNHTPNILSAFEMSAMTVCGYTSKYGELVHGHPKCKKIARYTAIVFLIFGKDDTPVVWMI